MQPAAVSISQASERGAVYGVDEIAAIGSAIGASFVVNDPTHPNAIAPEMPPEAFVERLSDRLTLLVQQQGVRKPALSKAMSTKGLDVLSGHAGQDYRRYVSKALALIALRELEQ